MECHAGSMENGEKLWKQWGFLFIYIYIYGCVTENRLVPLNPMVLLIIIPMKNGYFIGNINPTFSDKPIFGDVPFQLGIGAGFRSHFR